MDIVQYNAMHKFVGVLDNPHVLSAGTHEIMKSNNLLVAADKTSNFYRMDTTSYNDLLRKAITKTYKKVTKGTTNSIELEAKAIAKKLHLDDRINITAKREAFITLKDQMPNFANNPTCRHINPIKGFFIYTFVFIKIACIINLILPCLPLS